MVKLGSRPIGLAEAVLGDLDFLRPQSGRVKPGASSSSRQGFRFSPRASQLWRWIHHYGVTDFAAMTDVAKETRAALAGAGRTPISPGYLDTSLHVPLNHDSPVARRQDAIASVLWRGLQPDAQPRNQILMPPLAWDVTPDDAQAILTSVATAVHSGLAVARPMPAVIADAQALPPTPSATPPDNGTGNPKARYGDGITSQISTTMERIWGLTAALTVNTQTGLTGDQYTAPLA